MKTTEQDARAQALVAQIHGAACKGRGLWWSRREADHAGARTPEAARAAAQPALAICDRDGGCPMRDLCGEWARVASYTGLAAGAVFDHGQPQDTNAVLRKRPDPRWGRGEKSR